MALKESFIKRHIGKFFLGLIIAIIIVVINFFNDRIFKQALSFPLGFFSSISSGMNSSFKSLNNIGNLSKENTYLKKELSDLKIKLQFFDELKAENIRLKELLNLSSTSDYITVYAQIIARSPDNWNKQAIINIGEKKGIKVNTPLVNNQGLIGKVISCTPYTSTIQLLSDTSSAVSVTDERSGDVGIVTGSFPDKGKLAYLQQFSDVKPNDELNTSGLGGVFPKGLYVGKVIKTEKVAGEILNNIEVKFAIDFKHLQEVVALISK